MRRDVPVVIGVEVLDLPSGLAVARLATTTRHPRRAVVEILAREAIS
jgi:hypothetical protein